MKEIKEYEQDLSSIRTMMERSVKFISLSGLSGVLAGFYALAGAAAAYVLIRNPMPAFRDRTYSVNEDYLDSMADVSVLLKLLIIAFVVLTASITTGLWMSHRKARKHNITLWNSATRRLLINVAIPLVTGGIFILIVLYH